MLCPQSPAFGSQIDLFYADKPEARDVYGNGSFTYFMFNREISMHVFDNSTDPSTHRNIHCGAGLITYNAVGCQTGDRR